MAAAESVLRYYVTGEYVRTDVVDGQTGVPVHLEYQYVDVSTCDTVPDLYLETWQANATGVYSGIQANGNGNDEDATNLVSCRHDGPLKKHHN